jgi:hypothetical protein
LTSGRGGSWGSWSAISAATTKATDRARPLEAGAGFGWPADKPQPHRHPAEGLRVLWRIVARRVVKFVRRARTASRPKAELFSRQSGQRAPPRVS